MFVKYSTAVFFTDMFFTFSTNMFVKDKRHTFRHDSYISIKSFILIIINKKEEWSTEINITLQGVQVVESIDNFEEKIVIIF